MPNNTGNQDINFQPKTQGYSYNTNNSSSKNSNSKIKNYGIYLIFGIILLIIILLAGLLYLNNSGNIKTVTKQGVSQNTKNLGESTYNPDSKQTTVSAIFIGLNKNNLDIETSEGKKTFTIDSNTTFESLIINPNSSATNGGTLDSGQTYTLDTFANQVPKGSFLQIFYVTEEKNLKAVKVYYIPGYKFK